MYVCMFLTVCVYKFIVCIYVGILVNDELFMFCHDDDVFIGFCSVCMYVYICTYVYIMYVCMYVGTSAERIYLCYKRFTAGSPLIDIQPIFTSKGEEVPKEFNIVG